MAEKSLVIVSRLSLFLLGVVVIGPTFFLVSCKDRPHEGQDSKEEIKGISPPRMTVLADLPDSLQPVVIYLNDRPSPKTTEFPMPTASWTFIDSVTGLQIPPEAQGKGFFANYTMNDGLAQDFVHCMYVDRLGHLWFGTMGSGVTRYDGKTFTTYTIDHGLPSNTIWKIMEDRSGNLWFGTFGGVSRYDGKTFTNFTTEHGLPHNDCGVITEDNAGNLWIGAIGGGVSRYDGKTFTNFDESDGLTNNAIWCIEKDQSGRLWIGTRGGGVFYYDDLSTERSGFAAFNGWPGWMDDIVSCIKEDSKGNIWFGTVQEGLFLYDGTTLINFSEAHGLGCNGVNNILEDKEGVLWFGTCKGVTRYDGKTFITYSTKHGLPVNHVNTIQEDKAGYLWFGTYGGGVVRYDGSAFSRMTANPIDDNILSAVEDSFGTLWFATYKNGISGYDGKRLITFTHHHGLPRNHVNSIVQDRDGKFWFSTYYGGGVSCLEFQYMNDPHLVDDKNKGLSLTGGNELRKAKLTNFTITQGLPHDAVNAILKDDDGNLWIATYGGGLTRYDGGSFTTFTTKQGLADDEVLNVFQDSGGDFWIMYSGAHGITKYDGDAFMHFTIAHGLVSNSAWCMTEDREGNLWCGTEEGLSVLRNDVRSEIADHHEQHIGAVLFESFTTQHGLPSNYINSLESDQDGNVFVGTNNGLVKLKDGLNGFKNPENIEIYNSYRGHPLRAAGLLLKDSRGILWINTGSQETGFLRFDPSALHNNIDTPNVIIKSVKVNNTSVVWLNLHVYARQEEQNEEFTTPAFVTEEVSSFGRKLSDQERDSIRNAFSDIKFDSVAKWYPIPIKLVLPYRHNSVTFDFNAIVTARNQMVRYQHLLEGYDKDWSPISDKASATFGNIREGNYTFKVKARSPDGVWSEPISYAFKVLPPMHRTLWAYCLYGLLFLSLMYLVHRYQKQRTIRTEQEKASRKQSILNERLRISRELHDEVGATLSGIKMYSHLAKEQIRSANLPEVKHSLDIMQESSGEMVNKLNDIVWLLNPDQADLQKLLDKLEDYARQMGKAKGMQVHVSVPEEIKGIELPIEHRRNIYLICKEAINNAVKYSEATLLNLEVKNSDHTLEFIVQDNGAGFDMQNVKTGNGLENMQKRAEEVGASLDLTSAPQAGTKMSVQVKFTH